MNKIKTQTTEEVVEQFDTRPQALAQWINNLPRGSIGKTAEMLYKALSLINTQTMKPASRFKTLETLRPSIHYVTFNMHKHMNGNIQPLNNKIMQVASASRAIFDLMSNGYRNIFHELQKHNSLFVDKKMLCTSLHRATTYINRSLMLCYETYAAYHHKYWEQLHELYEYAEVHKIENQHIIDSLLYSKRKSTVFEEYVRNVLLYLAEPHHLAIGEIHKVNNIIEQVSGLLTLEHISNEVELDKIKSPTIELDQDQAPQLPGKSPLTSSLEHCRIVNTTQITDFIKKQYQELAQQDGANPNDPKSHLYLLNKLIESWGGIKRRRFARQQVFEKVNITISLHHTHMQLLYDAIANKNEADRQHTESQYGSAYESIEVKAIDTENQDVWSTVYNWANNNNISDYGDTKNKTQESTCVTHDDWVLTNESAEGFCLLSAINQAEKMQVGEIISIQRKGFPQRSIGIIRWIKFYGTQSIEMGGVLISPQAQAISIICSDADNNDRIIDRGLLIPGIEALNRPQALLAFSRQHNTNDIVNINFINNDEDTIKIDTLISDNGTVSQFHFTTINKHGDIDKSTLTADQIEDQRFEDIWKTI